MLHPSCSLFLVAKFSAVLLCLLVGLQASTSEENLGQIKAMRVIGNVTAQSSDEPAPVPLTNGDLLYESYTIVTAAQASVVLVFSNGSTVRVLGNTKLELSSFRQDPLDQETVAIESLKAEPSTSLTELNLVYGELVGEVKKLSHSSSYSIHTPVGAAGIRGTIFHDRYSPEGDTATYSFTTTEGLVEFTDLAGRKHSIPAGQVLGGRHRPTKPAATATYRQGKVSAREGKAIKLQTEVMRHVRSKVVFLRKDGVSNKVGKPKLHKEPNGKRDEEDDDKYLKRERAARPPPPPAPIHNTKK